RALRSRESEVRTVAPPASTAEGVRAAAAAVRRTAARRASASPTVRTSHSHAGQVRSDGVDAVAALRRWGRTAAVGGEAGDELVAQAGDGDDGLEGVLGGDLEHVDVGLVRGALPLDPGGPFG